MTRLCLNLISGTAIFLGFAYSVPAQSQCQSPAQCQSLAEPLQTVVPVHLNVSTGDITVGATTYPGGNPGMHFVALKRQPDDSHLDAPNLIQSQTFTDPSSANQFLEGVLAGTPDALLILNAVGNYGFALNAVAKNLEQFGSATDIEGVTAAIPFVLIGNGGLNTAGAHQGGFSHRDMSGYLATDAHTNYKFIQTDYIKFDVSLDGTITIGQTAYSTASSGKVSGCNGTNAFHVVAVQRDAPDALIGNESYCTAQSNGEITHLIKDLSGLVGSESNLVFIASNGHPIPANWNFGTDGDARFYPLGQLIAQLGGYWETIVYLTPSDTYSLVGATAPPAGTPGARRRARESSSVYLSGSPGSGGHQSGALHGVLARGLRGNWYSPATADLTGQANLAFYQILAQQPVPFPHPATQGELNAFQYIAQQLCNSSTCNPRNIYADTSFDINTYLTSLTAMSDPQNGSCNNSKNTNTPFCIMRGQLLKEFDDVADIRAFNQNLSSLWAVEGTNTILNLLAAHDDIVASLPAPAGAPAPTLVSPLVNLFLGIAGALPTPLAPVFGLADTAFNFGMSLNTDPSGNPTISLTATVGTLEGQAKTHFTQQGATTGTQFDFIYQDWGKINTLGSALASAQPGSQWYWNGSLTTAQIVQAMDPSVQQAYYQSLMSAIYVIGSYLPNSWDVPPNCCWGLLPLYTQPSTYVMWNSNSGPDVYQPFNYPWYPPYTYPSDTANPYLSPTQPTATLLAAGSWLGIGSRTDSNDQGLYTPPASSILSKLFSPPSAGGSGLGVYRPAFFEAWPFPRITCDASYEYDQDVILSGCHWGSAAPPVEAVPSPFTKVSVNLGRISHSGTQFDIPLTVTNSGTTDADALFIENLGVRTLAGAGKVTLESPSLPVDVGTLAPGAITTVTVHLNVPNTVTKLELTENGTVQNGQLTPYRFSLGQVIFPQSQK